MRILALTLLLSLSVVAAVDYDSIDDYFDCGSLSDTDNRGNASWAFWAYVDSAGQGSNRFVFRKISAGAGGPALWWRSSNVFEFRMVQAVATTCQVNTYALDTWEHYTVVYDGSNHGADQKVYLNGVLQTCSASTDGSGGINDSNSVVWIGANPLCPDGPISTISWYDGELTANDAKILASGIPGAEYKVSLPPLRVFKDSVREGSVISTGVNALYDETGVGGACTAFGGPVAAGANHPR